MGYKKKFPKFIIIKKETYNLSEIFSPKPYEKFKIRYLIGRIPENIKTRNGSYPGLGLFI
jgi:hypothetical protein